MSAAQTAVEMGISLAPTIVKEDWRPSNLAAIIRCGDDSEMLNHGHLVIRKNRITRSAGDRRWNADARKFVCQA